MSQKRKEQRQKAANERKATYENATWEQRVHNCSKRRGNSNRELKRLIGEKP